MKNLYHLIENLFDKNRWKEIASKIYAIEKRFCYSDFEFSAKLCRDELERSGAKDVELIKLKADGKTIYGDFIMPQAWDYEYAKLEIVEPEKFKGKILADTSIHPFHIANRSCAIDKNVFEVIDIKKISENKNLAGCFVFCGNIHPRECRHEIEKTGATGIISSFSKSPEIKDGIFWVNGWVKNSGWYHTKEDRKMACFSITPADGELLQNLLDSYRVKVKAVVKSKIYDGHIHSITGLIPGKTKKEICFLAHLYEPMITDNATGVAGLIELCRVFNQMINEKKIIPEIGIRFLFSMERYGMMEFFEKRHNVIYVFNVDSITDDIVKTGSLHYTFYGSPSNLPFFGDWLFEYILSRFFRYPWKKQMSSYEDDSFVSDSSIGIPSGYFLSHPGKLHHNSYLEKTVNWQQGENVFCVLGTYALVLNGLKNNLETIIETSAKQELFSYLTTLVMNATDSKDGFNIQGIKERVDYFTGYLKKKYFSALAFNIKCRKNFAKDIDAITKSFLNNISSKFPKIQDDIPFLSNEDKKSQNLIITKRKSVFIFSLAGIPHSERIHPPEHFHTIINRIDGKKDLYQIFREVGFEREIFGLPAFGENEKKTLRKYIEYLAKYRYVEFKYRTIVSKDDIKKALIKLGIKKGDRIIVHSSLSSMGLVIGGAEAVCQALMELIGENGLLMMPSFNHALIFKNNPDAYFSPIETPTINGKIPETFWRMKNVYRSLNPTHSFAAWGKNAKEFVRQHHKVPAMGKGSPLELLERCDGKIVLIGTIDSNTFHHVVEMTNNVPCLGNRTEEYPVKLPSGQIVKVRTWSWRNGVCEITDRIAYMKYMIKHNLLKRGRIGNADVFVIDMKICRKIVEKFLKGKIKGYKGCKLCNIRPVVNEWTVESDWDEEKQKVKENTPAFVDDYDPVCF
ncbi:MAG: AAC(3) family N-acetyltransferase [Candidatus Omnitrophica bacterium]|nr:AAC(3) family N-acetyltransferase [Candidatus Omnitrophota bacterium]